MDEKEDEIEPLLKALQEPRLSEKNFQQLLRRLKALRSIGK